jgi:hypothetical protein
MEGVVDIEIDFKTYYSQYGVSVIEIMEEINNAGFDGGNKKTTKASGPAEMLNKKKNKLYANCV